MSDTSLGFSFENIKNDTYSQKIYNQLKEKILSNAIPADTVLRERDIAEQLGVSRSPVRDALRILEQEGWVKQEGRNKVVRMLTKREIRDIILFRATVELIAFDLMEKREDPVDVSALRAAFQNLEALSVREDKSRLEQLEADLQFHIELARLSGNVEYCRLYENYAERLLCTFFIINLSDSAVDSHRPVMEAIEAGNYMTAKSIYAEMLSAFEKGGADYLNAD